MLACFLQIIWLKTKYIFQQLLACLCFLKFFCSSICAWCTISWSFVLCLNLLYGDFPCGRYYRRHSLKLIPYFSLISSASNISKSESLTVAHWICVPAIWADLDPGRETYPGSERSEEALHAKHRDLREKCGYSLKHMPWFILDSSSRWDHTSYQRSDSGIMWTKLALGSEAISVIQLDVSVQVNLCVNK